MTKRTCKQCGALTEGVRFCTNCGAIISRAETANVVAPETRPLSVELADQMVSGNAVATEELPSARTTTRKAPPDYDTEEIPQKSFASRAEVRATTVVPNTPATRPQIKSATASQPSGGRKGFLLVAALGAVVIAAGSFFFINSRRAPETQTANQPADKAESAASAQNGAQPSTQPSIQPSIQSSIQPSRPQTGPQTPLAISEAKSSVGRNNEADSKPAQTGDAAKPTPAASQEKKDADGTGAALHNFNQGIAYLNAGRYQEALREFGYVKSLDPGNKSVYYLIGQTYQKLGQPEQALEAYRQCTSGIYASVAQNNVKLLEKKLGKTY